MPSSARRRRKPQGPLAKLIEGVEPKTLVLILGSLATTLGGCWKSATDVDRVEASSRAQVAVGASQRGRLRASFDSLVAVVDGQRVELAVLRGKVLRMERNAEGPLRAAREHWELVGPPAPPRRGTLLSSLGRLFGGR